MRIATWNVNSVRARIEHLAEFLKSNEIDVILLQELKCVTEAFPRGYFEDLGYNSLIYGQKSYNGVAILSRYRIECLHMGNEVFVDDRQARYVEALINGYIVASVYVPNGQDVELPAYGYKLNFLQILTSHIKRTSQNEKFIIGGDFNIARTDADVYNPKAWKGKVCCTERERELFEDLINIGLRDTIREFAKSEDEPIYTWWDYRRFAFTKNYGLRLDYVLATPNVEVKSCFIDKSVRGKARPSDHAPVIVNVE
ncbi:MAG: exodeoxyribonuclease III [Alphaproteobacteria bacterium]|nr:exodeoxyribonuclease III [Alphaproteobacteria bacterium]